MARIAGVDIPRDKRVVISLTYIFGIGKTTSENILNSTNINPSKRVKDLDEAELTRLREYIDRNYVVEGDLRREVNMNIKRLIEIGLLPWSAPPPQSAGAWSADTHERPHSSRCAQDCGRQEEDAAQVVREKCNGSTTTPTPRSAYSTQRAQERARWTGAYSCIVQQHHYYDYGSPGQYLVLGQQWQRWVQRQPQVDAVRRPAGGSECSPGRTR